MIDPVYIHETDHDISMGDVSDIHIVENLRKRIIEMEKETLDRNEAHRLVVNRLEHRFVGELIKSENLPLPPLPRTIKELRDLVSLNNRLTEQVMVLNGSKHRIQDASGIIKLENDILEYQDQIEELKHDLEGSKTSASQNKELLTNALQAAFLIPDGGAISDYEPIKSLVDDLQTKVSTGAAFKASLEAEVKELRIKLDNALKNAPATLDQIETLYTSQELNEEKRKKSNSCHLWKAAAEGIEKSLSMLLNIERSQKRTLQNQIDPLIQSRDSWRLLALTSESDRFKLQGQISLCTARTAAAEHALSRILNSNDVNDKSAEAREKTLIEAETEELRRALKELQGRFETELSDAINSRIFAEGRLREREIEIATALANAEERCKAAEEKVEGLETNLQNIKKDRDSLAVEVRALRLTVQRESAEWEVLTGQKKNEDHFDGVSSFLEIEANANLDSDFMSRLLLGSSQASSHKKKYDHFSPNKNSSNALKDISQDEAHSAVACEGCLRLHKQVAVLRSCLVDRLETTSVLWDMVGVSEKDTKQAALAAKDADQLREVTESECQWAREEIKRLLKRDEVGELYAEKKKVAELTDHIEKVNKQVHDAEERIKQYERNASSLNSAIGAHVAARTAQASLVSILEERCAIGEVELRQLSLDRAESERLLKEDLFKLESQVNELRAQVRREEGEKMEVMSELAQVLRGVMLI